MLSQIMIIEPTTEAMFTAISYPVRIILGKQQFIHNTTKLHT